MNEYTRLINRIAAGEAIDGSEALTIVGNAGKSIKQVLSDTKAACDRREWCHDCGRRGVIRSSRKDELGDRTFLIICPECKKTLSNQKRRNSDFAVYTQQLKKKYLLGSAEQE